MMIASLLHLGKQNRFPFMRQEFCLSAHNDSSVTCQEKNFDKSNQEELYWVKP
jgi:hypothetical protein